MVDICEEAIEKGWTPDIVTEMCPFHDPFAVIPSGLTPDEAEVILKTLAQRIHDPRARLDLPHGPRHEQAAKDGLRGVRVRHLRPAKRPRMPG